MQTSDMVHTIYTSQSILAHQPRLFSFHTDFLNALADLLITITKGHLSDSTVFLPYARAIPFLQEALYKRLGTCVLPVIRTLDCPLGYAHSVHSKEGHIPRLALEGFLLRKVRRDRPFARALELSQALAALLTQVGLHEGQWDALWDIVPEHLSHHFQVTATFLKDICKAPEVKRYVNSLHAYKEQLDQWQKNPPTQWVIAAGSFASLPGTAALLRAIRAMDKGLILFSLPSPLTVIPKEASHPLFTLGRFLKSIHCTPSAILSLSAEPSSVRALFFLASYGTLPQSLEVPPHTYLLSCPTIEEEALTIAHTLQEGEGDALLVTPDRSLLYRVACHLRRLGLAFRLLEGPSCLLEGTFLLLVLDLVLDNFTPAALLAVLRHPLYLATHPSASNIISLIEKQLLRGRYVQDVRILCQKALQGTRHPRFIKKVWSAFYATISPLKTLCEKTNSLASCLSVHRHVVANLLGKEHPYAAYMQEWAQYSRAYGPLTGQEYRLLLHTFLEKKTLPTVSPTKARITLSGPLEARLLYADTIVLGGLNEGSWPSYEPTNPWLNRLMKDALDLPPDTWSIGLSARDFLAGLTGKKVFLTRSLKHGGTEALPSRFVVRMDMLMRALGHTWQAPASTLQPPLKTTTPAQRPKALPQAPLHRIAATDIDTLQRDPYAFYIKKILRLRPLDPLMMVFDKRYFGILVHRILEEFMRTCPHNASFTQAQEVMATCAASLAEDISGHFLWSHRLRTLLSLFLEEEWALRQKRTYTTYTEWKGSLTERGVTLTAIIDRLDVFPEGKMRIIDYKTGALPPKSHVESGRSPQLIVQAFLALRGALLKNHTELAELAFWQLTQTHSSPSQGMRFHEIGPYITESMEEIYTLLHSFQQGKPYTAACDPQWKELALLSRLEEWRFLAEEEAS